MTAVSALALAVATVTRSANVGVAARPGGVVHHGARAARRRPADLAVAVSDQSLFVFYAGLRG